MALCKKAWSVLLGAFECLYLSKSVGKTGLLWKDTSGGELTFCRQDGHGSFIYLKEMGVLR